jgi:hypothetical protein
VPLFYFVLHLTLIHLLAVIVCYAQNGAVHWMFESPNLGAYPFTRPPGWGLSLPVISVLWIRRCRSVSGVPLVCRDQATTHGGVAQLSLTLLPVGMMSFLNEVRRFCLLRRAHFCSAWQISREFQPLAWH